MDATKVTPKKAARGRPRKADAGAVTEKFVEAAIHLFWAKGFADTNTRDIGEACGVSPGAMYFHYKSKSELLFRVLSEAHERIAKLYLEAIGGAGSEPAEQFHALVRAAAWFHAAHYKEAVVMHREFKFLEPPFYDRIRTARLQVQRSYEMVVQRGLDAGVFTSVGHPKRPARQLTIAIGNMCNQIAEWYNPNGEMTPDDIGEFYADLALRMVTAR